MTAVLMTAFFVCLVIGVPIAIIMGLAPLITLVIERPAQLQSLLALNFAVPSPLVELPQRMFHGINSFPLMAVPFFILASELMTAGRITAALLNFSLALIGHIRGGLGQVNVLVSVFFAGISGSALADAAGPGAIVMRMMRRAGYPAAYSAALSAAAATIAPIIPPSIIMVIYAISDNSVTVGALFLAGVVPGLLLALALGLVNWWLARRHGYGGTQRRATWRERLTAFREAFPSLLMPAIILGGILSGAFTPTEAAAVAAVYALGIGLFVTRTLTLQILPGIFIRSGIMTAAVLLIVATATIFAKLLTLLQVLQYFAAQIGGLGFGPTGVMVLLALLVLFAGLFIDTLPAVIILVPVLVPVALRAGIDPLHFAMMLTLNLTIGMIHPPVGAVLFVMSTVARIRFETLSLAILPLLLAELAVLALIVFIPELSVTVPHLFGFTR